MIFPELHRLVEKHQSWIKTIYNITEDSPTLYDLFNAPKIDRFLEYNNNYPPLECGRIDRHVLQSRYEAAIQVIQGSRWRREAPEFCTEMKIVLDQAQQILSNSEQESAYQQWLINIKKEESQTLLRSANPSKSYQSTMNTERADYREHEASDINNMKQQGQYEGLLESLFPVILYLLVFAVILVLFFSVPGMLLLGPILVPCLYYMLTEGIEGAAKRISRSYATSINIAIAASSPTQIASEIRDALRELEQYGLCFNYVKRELIQASDGPAVRGNPNIAALKEVIAISEALGQEWETLGPLERSMGLDLIRQKLLSEQNLSLRRWIVDSGVKIQNRHIPPRYR